jgi:hypothetical protein
VIVNEKKPRQVNKTYLFTIFIIIYSVSINFFVTCSRWFEEKDLGNFFPLTITFCNNPKNCPYAEGKFKFNIK